MRHDITNLLSRFPDEIVLHVSRLKFFRLATLQSIGVAVGIWALSSGKPWIIANGVFLCLVFIPVTCFCLLVAISGRGRLILRKNEIQATLFRSLEPASWNEIRNFRPGLLGFSNIVRYDKWVATPSASTSQGGKWVTAYIPDTYGMKIEDLLALLTEYQTLASRRQTLGSIR